MEFFEKAHHNQSLSNKNKLEHKKQLKRMLDGHKKQNINIIKSCEYVILDQDFDLSVSSDLETNINEEIEVTKTTSNASMNSVSSYSSSDNSQTEKFNYVRIKKLKSKSKFDHNTTDDGSFEMSVKGSICKNEFDLKEQAKKPGKAVLHKKDFTNRVHLKNVIEQTDKSRSSSPLFVSFAPNDVSSNLNDVFNDYSTTGTESFSLKCTPSADFTLDTETKLFSSSRLKKNKVKCTEAEDFEINKTHRKEKNCNSKNPAIDTRVEKNKQVDQVSEDLSQESQLNKANTIISFPYKIFKVKDGCVILLKHPAEVYLHGKAKVLALGGTTEILGYTLTPSCASEIYAPHNSYALILKTVEISNNYYGLFSKLTGLGLSVAETEDIVTTLGVYDGILYFQKLESKKLDHVNSIFRNNLFPNSNVEKNILDCTFYSEIPRKCFYENPLWANISDNDSDSPARGIICGGKGVGKSTFLKYFVNKQLSYGPVLVIDLDPGQCEFTVAGNVSATVVKAPIIGPNYTHLRTPDRMLHIGMINVMSNLTRYISAITKLIEYCKKNKAYEELPWIVNTMGMCNAVGLKLLLYIILSLKPTFLFQLDFESYKKRFEYDLNPENVKMLHSTQFKNESLLSGFEIHDLDFTFFSYKQHVVSTELKSSISPKDERYFNYLAYFGELLDQDRSAISLLGITPYVAPLKSLYIGLNTKVCESFIDKVLNGKIIALCQYLPKSLKKIFTLANEPLVCMGYGLVRGIDTDSGLLYVLTPITWLQLSQVTCVVYSDWTPEIPSDEKTLAPGTLIPYRAEPLCSQPELMQAPRRRFNPLQLLRLAKSS